MNITICYTCSKGDKMTILVTGATGTIGARLSARLSMDGLSVRVMTRSPETSLFPKNVQVAKGDFSDLTSLRSAMEGVSTLFLLNAVRPDELHQGITAVNAAHEAGVRNIVYLSVMDAEKFVNVPHFAAKVAVERAIRSLGFSGAVLRPNYFMQNDLDALPVLVEHSVYPMVIGSRGVSMVDVRDIVDAAVIELTRLECGDRSGFIVSHNLVGADVVSADIATDIWSSELGKPIYYVGDDLKVAEDQLARGMPRSMAFDLCRMFEGFQTNGFIASSNDVEQFTSLLGRSPRRYRSFVQETLAGFARSSKSGDV